MRAKWFTNWEHIDWVRMWSVIGFFFAFWGGLTALTFVWPAFDHVHKIVNIFLGAITGALVFAARSTKFVENRIEPPADGKP